MPYRQNAESLEQVLEDARDMASAAPGVARRAEIMRMLDRVDHAVALAGPTGAPIVDALRTVRDELAAKARDQKTSARMATQENPEEKKAARASARGEQLRILEVFLKESNVGAAIAFVTICAKAKKPLDGPQRVKLTETAALLRARFDNGQTMLQLAIIEPCSDTHARILNPRFDKVEEDLRRVFDAWRLAERRLSRP